MNKMQNSLKNTNRQISFYYEEKEQKMQDLFKKQGKQNVLWKRNYSIR